MSFLEGSRVSRAVALVVKGKTVSEAARFVGVGRSAIRQALQREYPDKAAVTRERYGTKEIDPDSATSRAIALMEGGMSQRKAAAAVGIQVGALRAGRRRRALAPLPAMEAKPKPPKPPKPPRGPSPEYIRRKAMRDAGMSMADIARAEGVSRQAIDWCLRPARRTPPKPPRENGLAAYTCSACGGDGHSKRTCLRRDALARLAAGGAR